MQKVALTLGWLSKPEQFAITNYIFRFKFSGGQPEESSNAAQIVFRKINKAAHVATLDTIGLAGEAEIHGPKFIVFWRL